MQIIIVIPVFDDWSSFLELTQNLDNEISSSTLSIDVSISILAVDDGSTSAIKNIETAWSGLRRIHRVDVLRLAVNLGHQRAIAVGLVYVDENEIADAAIFMDADGEDRPVDVIRLIQEHLRSPREIILAKRTTRSEGPVFRIGYLVYRRLFRLLTGTDLGYGNFSLVPRRALSRLSRNSDLWNHFAAAISRANIPTLMIPASRGRRYKDKSHMNFISLFIHGLSAMSVHTDRIAARLIVASILSLALFLLAVISVILIKSVTNLAIPGWASLVVGILMIAIILSAGFAILLMFMTLQARRGLSFVPRSDAWKYIDRVENWYPLPNSNISAKS